MAQEQNHIVYTDGGPVTLTDDQERIREAWKARVAAMLTGADWTTARVGLTRAGLTTADATETLLEAVSELLENGWADYL